MSPGLVENTDARACDYNSMLQAGGESDVNVQETQMFLDFGMLNIAMDYVMVFSFHFGDLCKTHNHRETGTSN